MRHRFLVSICLVSSVALAACEKNVNADAEVERAVKDLNVIDETNLNDIMLTVADPDEAVAYFKKAALANPDRLDMKRGLAVSYIRAKRPREAVTAWQAVVDHPDSTHDDKVELAGAQIRNGDWSAAEATLNSVPPTVETYKRYRLEAMVADSKKQWKKADSFYETALGLTTKPAGVLNNWGYSKLTRGDFSGAEKLFADAISYDPKLFTAKNNLVLARGAQRKYDLPILDVTQDEQAELLYTLALSAIKQGDVKTGQGLLKEAIETHPQHFEAAARALRALETG
ncbi:Tetratricopeptide repeat protein [Pseudoruegeria aquimaris]|uniref:Tetratricopeptide repeat protein n=1 Tax=Pseudoruegeria aquimaris TaxID=393663 RepID=A0A1Y5SGL0_9RHOB|nr:tetratricopeptide repeat protein [Pseudoruegeria aquimaris]SLN37490.1 Tetratricopeptide repeat protein [Pseudoruegeria aquimaris]